MIETPMEYPRVKVAGKDYVFRGSVATFRRLKSEGGLTFDNFGAKMADIDNCLAIARACIGNFDDAGKWIAAYPKVENFAAIKGEELDEIGEAFATMSKLVDMLIEAFQLARKTATEAVAPTEPNPTVQ